MHMDTYSFIRVITNNLSSILRIATLAADIYHKILLRALHITIALYKPLSNIHIIIKFYSKWLKSRDAMAEGRYKHIPQHGSQRSLHK